MQSHLSTEDDIKHKFVYAAKAFCDAAGYELAGLQNWTLESKGQRQKMPIISGLKNMKVSLKNMQEMAGMVIQSRRGYCVWGLTISFPGEEVRMHCF